MLSRSLFISASALLVSLLSSPVSAQLETSCDPTTKSCPADPAFGTAHTFNFNDTPATGLFTTEAGTVDYDATTGAAFTISQKGYSPTLISAFYFFWGRTEVLMKAATGTGIISTVVWGSDDRDEMDWEFKGGDAAHAQTNYFGKGRNTTDNGMTHNVTGGVQADYHNYTNVWTADKLEWWIDGELVRTLLPADANNTNNYPQTPMKLRIGIWAGGDSSQAPGTIEWAGGATDYTKGPYTMYVKSARVEDYSSGKEYYYSDLTGSSKSIKITEPNTNSTALTTLNQPAATPSPTIADKWNALPSTTKIGIYAAAGGVGALLAAYMIFSCIKQRRRGRREAAIAAKANEDDRLELERFKREGRNPDELVHDGADYDASAMRKDGMVSTTAYSVPASRSNSFHSSHEKASAWDPTVSGAATPAMRSPMPLLLDGANSPRMASPGPQSFNAPSRNNSFAPVSPMRSQSPGMPPQFPPPASPAPRSFSPANAAMRMGSPGPQPGVGYGGMNRMQSPAPLQPQNRSLSSPRSPAGGYSNGGGYQRGDEGYWNGNNNGNGYR